MQIENFPQKFLILFQSSIFNVFPLIMKYLKEKKKQNASGKMINFLVFYVKRIIHYLYGNKTVTLFHLYLKLGFMLFPEQCWSQY